MKGLLLVQFKGLFALNLHAFPDDKCSAASDKHFITDSVGSVLCVTLGHKSKIRNMVKAKRTM